MFTIHLFGGASLEGPSGPLSGPALHRHRVAMLALLTAAGEQGVSREKLAGYLWPENDAAHARHLVAHSVYVLRSALGEEAILTSGDSVRLNPDVVASDVVAFRDALEHGDLEAAAHVYAGAFLDGFYLSDAGEFEHWMESERSRLAGDYARAVESLAEAADQAGDFRRAADHWHRLTLHDPFNSRYVVNLMGALTAAGDPANALKQAKEHESLLREELGIELPPELQLAVEKVTYGSLPLPALNQSAVSDPSVAVSDRRGEAGKRFSWRWGVGLGAVTVLIAATGYWGLFLRTDRLELSDALIVVAPFENRTGDPDLDVLGYLAADRVTEGLSRTGIVWVVPFARAFVTSKALSAGKDSVVDDDVVRAFAAQTGAGVVVTGSYYQQNSRITFEAWLREADTGRILYALEPVRGALEEPTPCIEALASRLMTAVTYRITPWLTEPRQLSLWTGPDNFAAYREYLAAFESHYVGQDWTAALEHLERAAAFDTSWLWPTFNKIYSYGTLGERAKRDSILRFVNDRRDRLTSLERQLLDSEIARGKGDFHGRLRALRRAAKQLPGDPTVHWNLGQALLQTNRPEEALRVLTPLRGKVWGWEVSLITRAYHLLGNHRQELQEAQRARQENTGLRALWFECRALVALGDVDAVMRRLDESLILRSGPLGATPGYVMEIVGLELHAHGYGDAAREAFERAIDWYRERGAEANETRANRSGLARSLYAAGHLEEAGALFENLVRDAPRNIDAVAFRGYLGAVAAQKGDRELALELSQELGELEQPEALGENTYWQACIAALLGDKERAVGLLREALRNGYSYFTLTPDLHSDLNLTSLHGYPPFQELLRPKG